MKKAFLIGMMLCVITALTACSSAKQQGVQGNQSAQNNGQAASGEPKGGIAVYGYHDEVMTFWDPSDSYSNEIVAMNNMYETLLRYNPQQKSFEKGLAEDYKVSKDGLTWTFTLRKGVKFHTGATMTAESVKKSIERTLKRGKGAAFIWDSVEKINVVNENTVEFKLKYPAPLDTVVSSGYAAFIFDADALEKNGDDWVNEGHDVGSGPYTVQKWSKGSELILTYFPEYWKAWKTNNFQKVVFKTTPEANTRQQMIQAGQMDYTDQLPIEMINKMQETPGIKVEKTESFQQLEMQFNTQKAPLNEKKVRQALAYAIPYQNIINDILSGNGSQSYGIIPKALWGADTSLKQFTYDLDKAKALLKEAGVNGGKLTLTYTSGDEFERRISELLKVELAKIGFDLEIKGMLWEAQWDMAKAKDPSKRQDILLMYWWADYADPYSFLKNLYGSEDEIVFNLAYYKNPAYDKAIQEGSKVAGVDRDSAITQYKQAQQVLIEDVPGLSLYDMKYVRVLRDNFKGYVDNPAYPNVVFFYDTHRE